MKLGKLPVLEAYVAIQTEGSRAGYPHFIVRTSGCTHRCFFGEGGWCDSWQTSIVLEKPQITGQKIIDMFTSNPDINHLMITGGSPTMHPELVNDLVVWFKEYHGRLESSIVDETKSFITIETEGSHFVETQYKIDLISLSPKFKNSIPQIGVKLPGDSDKITTPQMIKQHNKFRMNHKAIAQTLAYHRDYHFKPVVDRNDPSIWKEIEEFAIQHNIPKQKTWIMPAGDSREAVIPNYTYVLEECVKRGYNFTGRAHIIAFDTLRGV